MAAVVLEDVGDDLLPPSRFDVEVDVGWSVALGGEEPFEQQSETNGVGPGDAQGETDGRVGRRPPTLAVDVVTPAELHDVPDDEEIAGEPEGADHRQLVVDLGPGSRYPLVGPRSVAHGGPPPGQFHQPGLLVVSGRNGEVGEPRCHQPEVEGALGPEFAGPGHGPRPPGEAPLLFPGTPEVGGGRRRQPPFEIDQGPPGPDGGQGGGQRPLAGGGVVDVVGGHHVHPPVDSQPGQGVIPGRVEGIAVGPELHRQVLPTEGLGQPVELLPGGGGPGPGEGGGDGPLPTAGEDQPVPPVPVPQVLERARRGAFGPPGQVGFGDGPTEPAVALRVPGQDHQMGPHRVGPTRPGRGGGRGGRRSRGGDQGELGSEDGGEPDGPGRLGEADHPVQAVVIGEGQGAEPEPGGLGHQLLGVGGTIEEAEVGVAVQFGVAARGISRRSPPATSRPARA